MDLEYGERYESFRQEVRAFLDKHAASRPKTSYFDTPRAELSRWLSLQIDHCYWARTIPMLQAVADRADRVDRVDRVDVAG